MGAVKRKYCDAYLDAFNAIPGASKSWLGMGTKLLTMKRPDHFVWINNPSRVGYADIFLPRIQLRTLVTTGSASSNLWKSCLGGSPRYLKMKLSKRYGWGVRQCWMPSTTTQRKGTSNS
jgi:hypothetical protein